MEAPGYLTSFVVTAIVATAGVLLVRGIPSITRYLRIRRMCDSTLRPSSAEGARVRLRLAR
jgi:hypothetical protein